MYYVLLTMCCYVVADAAREKCQPTFVQPPFRLNGTRTSSDKPCMYFEVPSYEQIFKPPPATYRKFGKLYGKELFRQQFSSQYLTLMMNRRIIKGWLMDLDFFSNPPNLRDEEVSGALKSLIEDKKSELAALNFKFTTYHMQAKEIYDLIKEILHYAKKKLKVKDRSSVVNHVVSPSFH